MTDDVWRLVSSLPKFELSEKVARHFEMIVDMRSIADRTFSNTYNGAFLAIRKDNTAFSFFCDPQNHLAINKYIEEFEIS